MLKTERKSLFRNILCKQYKRTFQPSFCLLLFVVLVFLVTLGFFSVVRCSTLAFISALNEVSDTYHWVDGILSSVGIQTL